MDKEVVQISKYMHIDARELRIVSESSVRNVRMHTYTPERLVGCILSSVRPEGAWSNYTVRAQREIHARQPVCDTALSPVKRHNGEIS